MRDADTYAAETERPEAGKSRVVLITLREDDAVVVSNINPHLTYNHHDRDDVDIFIARFRLCVSRYQRR